MQPQLLGALLSYTVHAYARSQFVMYEDCPEIRQFTTRENGYLVLMTIIARMKRDEPSNGEIRSAVPVGEFAKHHAVSRGTVHNVLNFARERGWIEQTARGGREIGLSPTFVDMCERWVALELEWMGEMSKAALRMQAH
jgi:hypothetical protein